MASREDLYDEVVRRHGAALDRLARAYEADPDRRRDLLQNIHLALWRSFESFDGRCSLRTWTYRVAHNTGSSHISNDMRTKSRQLVSVDEIDLVDTRSNAEDAAERSIALSRLMKMIHELKPLDRQVVLLFLEGIDAEGIGEITGISAGNVATRIHRIKKILTTRFQGGEQS